MNKRRILLYALLGVLIAAALSVLWQGILPQAEERLLTQTLRALQTGDIETAEVALEQMAEASRDSTDQAALWAIRMGLAVARLATAVQLELEYAILAERLPTDSPAYLAYTRRSLDLAEAMPELSAELVEIAQTYRGRHYREGLRLQSPLVGTLPALSSDTEVEDALAHLAEGDDSERHHEALRLGIARVATSAILERVIEQPEPRPSGEVALTGHLDLAELLWLIGANSPNRELARWSMRRVLDETASEPAHPLRLRAQEVLTILESM